MKETPNHGLRYPEPSDPDTLAAYWENLAKDAESALNAINLSQLVADPGGADDGKLVIVKDGAAAYKAMSGDGTIDENGSFQLGSKVVGTTELGDKAVTAGKLDDGAVTAGKLGAGSVTLAKLAEALTEAYIGDGAVTSRKIKPTVKLLTSIEDSGSSGGAAVDIPGLKYEITPAVTMFAKVTMTLRMWSKSEDSGTSYTQAWLKHNGVEGESDYIESPLRPGASGQTWRRAASGFWLLELTKGELHTLQARFHEGSEGANTSKIQAGSKMLVELFAA